PGTRAGPYWRSRTIREPFRLPTECCASRTASLSARNGAPKGVKPCTSLHAIESARPMPRGDSSLNMLIVAAVLALGVGYYVPQTWSSKPSDYARAEAEVRSSAPATSGWAASAPGRVEPLGGEIHIASSVPGRIAEVLVGINDRVAAGELLVRLDDEEAIARV